MTREDAIQVLQTALTAPFIYGEYADALNMAIEALQTDVINRKDTVTLNSPITIQAEMVPVVRCKDCKHRDHCHETVAHTKEHNGFREHWSEPIEWCSRGERKGGDSE